MLYVLIYYTVLNKDKEKSMCSVQIQFFSLNILNQWLIESTIAEPADEEG